jgi:hypothetical protein
MIKPQHSPALLLPDTPSNENEFSSIFQLCAPALLRRCHPLIQDPASACRTHMQRQALKYEFMNSADALLLSTC